MDHAIVIGASMSGLLAAAALHRVATRVTVVDRDTLPEHDAHRRGVGQSRHAHGLLARGREAMEELLPGLTGELLARGALAGDIQEQVRWINDGHRLARGRSGMTGLLVGRPVLEGQVRRRVAALDGVSVRGDLQVTGLLAAHGSVNGVRLANGDVWRTDLVVDASGRGSRTPLWLREIGCRPPAEERVTIGLTYTTREFRRVAAHLGGDLAVVVGPTSEAARAGVALATEGDRWIVTLGGYGGETAPVDLDGFAAYAASLAVPDLHHLVRHAEPVGEPRTYRTPASVRRRYERLDDFPEGLVVVGDAVCAFNPLYGQGMTVAATEAQVLLTWAGRGARRPRDFFRGISSLVDGPWDIVVGGDLRLPGVEGEITPKVKLVNAYLGRFHAAAAHDPELGRRFLRVANLVDAPPALMSPGTMLRVLRSGAPRAVPVPA
ncbi:FAD-dependent oxidoreductase [Thermoactinospora rubra]|uniref:FAD-dependent oxidoreductase n=1 Tax=Thermoactinospora rubra TaxID=1088767 RepID=UPI000A0FF33C|nr:tryptophan 7-halogenase [Thermoactinospora rubra]